MVASILLSQAKIKSGRHQPGETSVRKKTETNVMLRKLDSLVPLTLFFQKFQPMLIACPDATKATGFPINKAKCVSK